MKLPSKKSGSTRRRTVGTSRKNVGPNQTNTWTKTRDHDGLRPPEIKTFNLQYSCSVSYLNLVFIFLKTTSQNFFFTQKVFHFIYPFRPCSLPAFVYQPRHSKGIKMVFTKKITCVQLLCTRKFISISIVVVRIHISYSQLQTQRSISKLPNQLFQQTTLYKVCICL